MDVVINAYCKEHSDDPSTEHTALAIGFPIHIIADKEDPDALTSEAAAHLREQYRSHLIDEHDRHDLIKRAEAS